MKRWVGPGLGLVVALAATWGCMLGKQLACTKDGDCSAGDVCMLGACTLRPCMSDDECKTAGSSPSCESHACEAGICTHVFQPVGPLPTGKQIPGDCSVLTCDGHGKLASQLDPTDVPPSSGAACMEMTCSATGAMEGPSMRGSSCALTSSDPGICDGAGTCVACIDDTGCTVGEEARCVENQCVSCSNGTQDGDEVGVDCGGACPLACLLGACMADTDCKSGACSGGLCRLGNGQACTSNAQCTSLRCAGMAGAKTCQACTVTTECAGGTCVAGACTMP